MPIDPVTLAFVIVGNVAVGGVGLLGVYKLMETNIALSALGGFGVAGLVVVGEWRLGEAMFTPTVSEMKLLAVVAVLGAIIGIGGTLLTVKPQT